MSPKKFIFLWKCQYFETDFCKIFSVINLRPGSMTTHFDIIWHLYEWGFEKELKGEVVGVGGKNLDKL